MSLHSSSGSLRPFWDGLGSVLDVGAVGRSSRRRRAHSPLATAWNRVRHSLQAAEVADQLSGEQQVSKGADRATAFSLREALIEAVYNQWEILEQRAGLARDFLRDHPDIANDLERRFAKSATPLFLWPDPLFRRQYFLSVNPLSGVMIAYPFSRPLIHVSESELDAALSFLKTSFPGAGPYIDYLTEIIKTIELEKLAEPYL